MARLRSAARERAERRRAEGQLIQMTTPEEERADVVNAGMVPVRGNSPPPLFQFPADPQQLSPRRQLVASIGEPSHLGSQNCPTTPTPCLGTPPYTWERTTPVNGRASGLFVLHLGETPQTSPMSRDPPNMVVNRKQLREALGGSSCGNLTRGRRGKGGVRRRLEDPLQDKSTTDVPAKGRRRVVGCCEGGGSQIRRPLRSPALAVAPVGWTPPDVLPLPRSPIRLRPRIAGQGGDQFVPLAGNFDADFDIPEPLSPPHEIDVTEDVTDLVRYFTPGASPPPVLIGDPVNSPSEHRVLHSDAFPDTLRVTVQSEVLDFDPSLVGNANGVTGVVLSRFFHHVTGTPMFQVDFGGAIGFRSIRVSDSTLEDVVDGEAVVDGEEAFTCTQRTLFPNHADPASDIAGPSEPAAEEDYEDDPDWIMEYVDFLADEAAADSNSESGVPDFAEDPLKELGLYNYDEDVSEWPFQRLFSDDQWQDQSITLLQDTNNFSGPTPGPTTAVGRRPVDYFMRYWLLPLLQRIVEETNRYAAQPCAWNPAVTNGRAEWTPIHADELLAWFGILMLMGLKEVPHIRCYWDRLPFYNCPLISEAMPRKRFEAIIRCLHLVNNDEVVTDHSDPAYDKIAKVRWLCEAFARMSQGFYNNERVLTVDEIMIPYKGRYCNIRQYMKSKPVKFGVKVWALANSQSRYVSNIIVYVGADDARTEGDSVGEDAVLTAVAGLEGRGHVVITDNFFTSPRLFIELLKRGFWATGTCRKTRKGFPSSLAGFLNSQLPERGHLVVKMHRSRHITAICWMDAKPVFLLSTACDPIREDSYAGRWVGRERVEFPTSPILLQYQAGMRGVDLVDQQRQEYSTQMHSHKWWHRIFMFVLDSQLLNSYIVYATDRRALGLPVLSRSLWHYEVAEDLIRPRMNAGHIRGPIRNLARRGLHFSSREGFMRRQCVVCGRRTRRMCPGCGGMFQCEGLCFRAVHTQNGYHAALGLGAV